jgi:hypothetical protein
MAGLLLYIWDDTHPLFYQMEAPDFATTIKLRMSLTTAPLAPSKEHHSVVKLKKCYSKTTPGNMQ